MLLPRVERRQNPTAVSRFVLLACVDGSDLHEFAERIRRDLDQLVASHHWSRPTWVVDEIAQHDRSLQPGDLPDWTLGVNHELPDDHTADGWFQDVERIVFTIGGIAAATGRTFVLCLADTQSGNVEDFASLPGDRVDLEKLRLALGARGSAEEWPRQLPR